jgi:glycerol uptake facilitator-like aquaporin
MFKSLGAEFIGTALLLATIVGSGIMAEDLSGGITGLALLANAIATGAILYVLITILGPVSGAHFNPVVTAAMGLADRLPRNLILPYWLAQIAGAIIGVWLAHLMFDQSILQHSTKLRWGMGKWVSEAVATFGLLLTIFGCSRNSAATTPTAVALYITSAYWFTASTSFANPAVTIARSLTNTFAGIAPSCVGFFVVAQTVGAILALLAISTLFANDNRRPS